MRKDVKNVTVVAFLSVENIFYLEYKARRIYSAGLFSHMSIYTKTGDDGTTAIFLGKRVKKYDLQIEAYGSVDELTSFLGVVISKLKKDKDKDLLTRVQKDLYLIMGVLCGGTVDLGAAKTRIVKFETDIDTLEKKLPKLTRFILPQGTEVSSWFHVLRTVCRRAERNVVYFFSRKTLPEQEIIVQYLNRLSDFLFMKAREYNEKKEVLT